MLRFLSDNILLVITLFFLVFIPLYPKLPLLDVKHTWVYIRVEDFLVAFAVVILGIQLLRKKASIESPLTLPIIMFWVIGGISTLFAIVFIFPMLINVFPQIALLHYLRRIEYLSVFFIGYSAIKDKRMLPWIVGVLTATLLCVVAYGVGQKLYPQFFPAFLTMNEEFSKGIPLQLSSAARIPSTFAGHYDLAAYLVLMIPIMASLAFGFRSILLKLLFIFSSGAGLILLFLTASRVSVAVYMATITFLLLILKKKIFIIPVLVASVLLLNSFQGISQRFGETISEADVVVDARTGKVIAVMNRPDKQVRERVRKTQVNVTPSPIIIQEELSTGESLPRSSVAVLRLPVGPEFETVTKVFYKRSPLKTGTESAQITTVEGDFVVKRVLTYDISFTTRFQGEWPRAWEAFKRNIFLGSGFSTISLATDNNYLRLLGEVGLLGLTSFLFIFFIFAIYITKRVSDINQRAVRTFALGVTAGLFGLGLNAVLIDVFEASKVAFVLWPLLGITVGLVHLSQKQSIHYFAEIKRVLTSSPAIIVGFLFATYLIFAPTLNNYFVGDDFTWLRWAADCKKTLYASGVMNCQSLPTTIAEYFTNADGFFYRPGMKLYFLLMYGIFWLNPFPYHVGSVLIHFIVTSLVFLVSLAILRKKLFAVITALFFLLASVHSEAVLWVSSMGHLAASLFSLIALLCFIYWKEKKSWYFLPASLGAILLSMMFHELGIVAPLLVLVYDLMWYPPRPFIHFLQRWYYALYIPSISLYVSLRYLAYSHGFSGDYSYRVSALLFNTIGNSLGYIGLILVGPLFMPLYQQARLFGREQPILIMGIILAFALLLFLLYKVRKPVIAQGLVPYVGVALGFFVVSLLPFLGLGNVTLRYSYLASFGIFLLCSVALMKVYRKVALFHRSLAVFVVGIIVIGFSLWNIVELYRVHEDWRKAGDLANKIIISVRDEYGLQPRQNPVFYIVNAPIRLGEAWVFPVGLKDALWFTFQNEYLTVETPKTLDLALDYAEGSQSAKVLEINRDGNVNEVTRTKETLTVPVTRKSK